MDILTAKRRKQLSVNPINKDYEHGMASVVFVTVGACPDYVDGTFE